MHNNDSNFSVILNQLCLLIMVIWGCNVHAAPLLTEREQAFLAANPRVVLGVGESFEPFVIKNLDGTYSGYDIQIARLISKHTGLEIDFEMGTWKEIQERAKRREVDGLLTAIFNEERAAHFVPSFPYFSTTSLIVVKKGNPEEITDSADIEGKKVAMQRGNVLFEGVLNAITNNVDIVYFDHIHEIISAVASGHADLCILDETTPYIAKKTGLEDYIEVAFAVGKPENIHILIRKDQPELQSIINKGLSLIKEEQMLEIRNQWFSLPEKSINWPFLIKIVLSMTALLGIVLYWSYTLKVARGRAEAALAELEKKDRELEAANRILSQLSITDPLTHLYNREKLNKVLDQELNRASRYGTPFGVIMADVDHFKKVNDEYGHPVGDSVLIEIAHILQANTRSVDIVGRWGGEEFLIISPQIGHSELTSMAEKLRALIEQHTFPTAESQTASFGITIYLPDDSAEQMITRADQALYLSKGKGRNQVQAVLTDSTRSPTL